MYVTLQHCVCMHLALQHCVCMHLTLYHCICMYLTLQHCICVYLTLQHCICLFVIGAGNKGPVVFQDILHKLIADDEVVIAKASVQGVEVCGTSKTSVNIKTRV